MATNASRSGPWQHSLLLGAAALVATAFFLSSSGTLAAWTSARVDTTANSVVADGAVILVQTDGATVCQSDAAVTNESSCTTIDVYGGAVLYPGASATVDIQFGNRGTAAAQSFSVTPGGCASTGQVQPAGDLCSAADALTVELACSPGTSFDAASAWQDLTYAADVPPTQPRTHRAVGEELGVGTFWTCRFTVRLALTAPADSQGVTVSQAFAWVLAR